MFTISLIEVIIISLLLARPVLGSATAVVAVGVVVMVVVVVVVVVGCCGGEGDGAGAGMDFLPQAERRKLALT